MAEESAYVRARTLVDGFQVSQAISAAVALGVPDTIGAGSPTCEEVANATQTHAPSLYRLLRALAAVGILEEGQDRSFALTEIGACLRSDAPEPVGDWAVNIGRPYFWGTWSHLAESVRSGENAFVATHNGLRVWEWREQHPDESAIFDRAMRATSRSQLQSFVSGYDFGAFQVVADIGGGNGAFLAGLLQAHGAMRGILVDQPHVVARASETLEAAGVADRCTVIGGSFFESVPGGADAYVLKHVLHDWEDDECVQILKTVRRGCGEARVLLLEWVVGPPNEGARAKLSDLNMLVMPGGRERTAEEWSVLLERGGFSLKASHPTTFGQSVIEAEPA